MIYSLVLEHRHICHQGGQHAEQLLPSHLVKTLDPKPKHVRSTMFKIVYRNSHTCISITSTEYNNYVSNPLMFTNFDNSD